VNPILKPKTAEEVLESISAMEFKSYRLSSFIKYCVNVEDARNLKKWCVTVFKMDPSDMEVTMLYTDSFFRQVLQRSVGEGEFASNANLKIIRFKDYFIYPRGGIGKIMEAYITKYDIKRKIDLINTNTQKL